MMRGWRSCAGGVPVQSYEFGVEVGMGGERWKVEGLVWNRFFRDMHARSQGNAKRQNFGGDGYPWVEYNLLLLVDLLLLVHAQLTGTHVDQEKETATVIVVRTRVLVGIRKTETYTMDRIWKKSYLAKSLWGWWGCSWEWVSYELYPSRREMNVQSRSY